MQGAEERWAYGSMQVRA
jgi:hypothetical protein